MEEDIYQKFTAAIREARDLDELIVRSSGVLSEYCGVHLTKLLVIHPRAAGLIEPTEKLQAISLSPKLRNAVLSCANNFLIDLIPEITEVDTTADVQKMIVLDAGGEIAGICLAVMVDEEIKNKAQLSIIAISMAETCQRLVQKAIIAAQENEIERCKDRIDSIVNDLNAIEQIKSNFISIASHELRTPLTVTRGYVEMLLEENGLDEVQKNTLNGVYKGVLKQEEILDSLFELAKFDSVSPVLNQERVLLSQLAREIVKKLTKPIRERQLKVEFEINSEPSVCVDTQSIRKLILNLVQNAIKFTPDNGLIKIVTATAVIGKENGVLLTIKDSGVGIEKEQLEVIFTRFYQPKDKLNTHSSGKTKFKGSGIGLGLALSRAIALAHNGKIWAESAGYDEMLMLGSEFKVFLPIKEDQ